MTQHRSANGFVTVEVTDQVVTDVTIVQGRHFRPGELEDAVREVLQSALAVGAGPRVELDRAEVAALEGQVARTDEMVAESRRHASELVAQAEAIARQLQSVPLPRQP